MQDSVALDDLLIYANFVPSFQCNLLILVYINWRLLLVDCPSAMEKGESSTATLPQDEVWAKLSKPFSFVLSCPLKKEPRKLFINFLLFDPNQSLIKIVNWTICHRYIFFFSWKGLSWISVTTRMDGLSWNMGKDKYLLYMSMSNCCNFTHLLATLYPRTYF